MSDTFSSLLDLGRIKCEYLRMRTLRYTLAEEACYFLRTELSDGLPEWDAVAREALFRQLFRTADFCGVKVVEAVVLPRELLCLAVVDPGERELLDDGERVRRYRDFYGEGPGLLGYDAEELERSLAQGGPRAEGIRARLDRNFHDLSTFMKILKQRFAKWYNAHHRRRGTMWRDRFQSALIQQTVAVLGYYRAFIRSAPLREGEAKTVVAYRWSTARENPCRRGLGPAQREASVRLEKFMEIVFMLLIEPLQLRFSDRPQDRPLRRPRWPDFLERGGIVGEASFVEHHTRRWRGYGRGVPLPELRTDATLHASHWTRRWRVRR